MAHAPIRKTMVFVTVMIMAVDICVCGLAMEILVLFNSPHLKASNFVV